MLDNVKILLDIDGNDTSKDALLNLYITRATDAIVSYCNFLDSTEIPSVLNSLIEDIAVFKYRNKGNENLKMEMLGSRNSTYFDDLPKEFKARMMPFRKVKVMG
jgi:hypothetical protein